MTFRKYLILAAVAVFASCGDVCLARGMRDFGAVTAANWHQLFGIVLNPWVLTGIGLLLLFFGSYLTALSWADLTFVLPATALSYVLMALLAGLLLHENVTFSRWLGIAFVTVGVGFVASGPAVTPTTLPKWEPRDPETRISKSAGSDA
ncbi:MAG: EamA family transporter [Candidatus Korobacteraceae bacterium]